MRKWRKKTISVPFANTEKIATGTETIHGEQRHGVMYTNVTEQARGTEFKVNCDTGLEIQKVQRYS
jgi:hypothetical protein